MLGFFVFFLFLMLFSFWGSRELIPAEYERRLETSLGERPAHPRALRAFRGWARCSRVPWWRSECVLEPPPTTTTPSTFCLLWALNRARPSSHLEVFVCLGVLEERRKEALTVPGFPTRYNISPSWCPCRRPIPFSFFPQCSSLIALASAANSQLTPQVLNPPLSRSS